MGQAKQRKAEINELKANSAKASNDFGILDVMYKFGDGEWADNNRNEMLHQILQTMKSNLGNIVRNANLGKTTRAEGIQVGFELGKMIKISDYHICVESSKFIDAISAFERAFAIAPKHRLLECGMMSSIDTKTIAPFMAFMNPGCNIVITKWKHGSIIRFFDDSVVDRHDLSGDAQADAKSLAEFAQRNFA